MSIDTLQFRKVAEVNAQMCPLCGMPQEGFVQGTITVNGEYKLQDDKWYSFCNCHNIFFTDWSNMKQEVYDESYQKKYEGAPINKKITDNYHRVFNAIPVYGGTFVEVGVVTDQVMDIAKVRGFDPIAVDINSTTKTKYPLIIGSLDESTDKIPMTDVIWLSHVVEHLKNPIDVMTKLFDRLNPEGCIYVSMPDPWFIPWENPHCWAHWHCQEHHIMWDMDSFIDMMIGLGYELVTSYRRSYGADYHIIMRRP